MIDTITRGVRYSSLVMIFTSLVGAVALIYIGTEKMFRAIWDYFTGTMPPNAIKAAQLSDVFIVRALESLDAFLIAFALTSFGYGIFFLVFRSHRPKTARVPGVSPRQHRGAQSVAHAGPSGHLDNLFRTRRLA